MFNLVPRKRNLTLRLPIQYQYFPFLPTYINYVLQNASPSLLLKFYHSCKYFYFKLRITIAPEIIYRNNPNDKSIEFPLGDKNERRFFRRKYQNIENIWLTDKLRIFTCNMYRNGLIGNHLLNKIYRNNLRELSISSQYTIFNELKILCKSPNLTKVTLLTKIKNVINWEPIPIEKIMVLFPNIIEFLISLSRFTLETFNKLSKFKFRNKIRVISFYEIANEFDPISFCNFLKENITDDATLAICFTSFELKSQLLPHVKEIINGWETKKLKHFFHM